MLSSFTYNLAPLIKFGCGRGQEFAADLVILNPELTLSPPESLTAATGLDAVVHAIEACTVKKSHPLAQALRTASAMRWEPSPVSITVEPWHWHRM